jgi:hypothetical protein
MLNRFPRHVPTLPELRRDPLLSHITSAKLASLFGVSERTVRRWMMTDGPLSVRLALWVFSCEGLELRDSERAYIGSIIGTRVGRLVLSANDQTACFESAVNPERRA